MTDLADDRTEFYQTHGVLNLVAEDGSTVLVDRDRLPRLIGWTVLLQPWSPPAQTKGGIFLPDQVKDANDHLTYLFKVLALGPLAFTHPRLRGGARHGQRSSMAPRDGEEFWTEIERTDFAEGVVPPEVDDWVIVRKYAGIRLELNGADLKLCNDDDILAVVDSPQGWKVYV
jgi:co-chaperonin GroES (HSP10)